MNRKKSFKGRKKGFTLAEMLIVLAIVGIVAAITVPLVISKANNAKFISALQKASNTLTNVVNTAQSDVKMESWEFNFPTETLVNTYILPYLNIAKNCGMGTGGGCFANNYEFKDGTQDTDYDNSSDYYKFITGDGISIAIKGIQGCTTGNPSVCIEYIVDVNGMDPPNKWGKDVHSFQTLANLNAVVPYGTFNQYNELTKKWEFEEPETITQNCIEGDGKYCTIKIINDGWQINY